MLKVCATKLVRSLLPALAITQMPRSRTAGTRIGPCRRRSAQPWALALKAVLAKRRALQLGRHDHRMAARVLSRLGLKPRPHQPVGPHDRLVRRAEIAELLAEVAHSLAVALYSASPRVLPAEVPAESLRGRPRVPPAVKPRREAKLVTSEGFRSGLACLRCVAAVLCRQGPRTRPPRSGPPRFPTRAVSCGAQRHRDPRPRRSSSPRAARAGHCPRLVIARDRCRRAGRSR